MLEPVTFSIDKREDAIVIYLVGREDLHDALLAFFKLLPYKVPLETLKDEEERAVYAA
jgi:hypothetical protein